MSIDLEHGQKQLERMLADRQPMVACVEPGDDVWVWAQRQLGGEACGSRIFWFNPQAAEPLPADFDGHDLPLIDLPQQFAAYSLPPVGGRPGLLTISESFRGEAMSGSTMWASLVTELYNCSHVADFAKLWQDACREDDIDRDEFCRRGAAIEFESLLATREFYESMWKRQAELRKFEVFEPPWRAGLEPTFEDWLARFADRSRYPWVVYGTYFDRQILPSRASLKK